VWHKVIFGSVVRDEKTLPQSVGPVPGFQQLLLLWRDIDNFTIIICGLLHVPSDPQIIDMTGPTSHRHGMT
jgi:hypothetical protein